MRASSVLLDHNAAGASPERYTHIFISSIDPIGLRQEPYGPTTWPGAAPSNAGTTFVSVAPFAPPPARVETPPPPPSPLAVWQPGHWSWSGGQYVWIAGQYVQRPALSANWVPGYWQQGPNGWIWTEGRWA